MARMNALKKKILSGIALVLAGVLIANAVMIPLIQVKIERSSAETSEGTANNYLIENTEYVSKDTINRMKDVIQVYYRPSNWQEYEEQAGIFIAQEKYGKALVSITKAIDLSDDINETRKSRLWLQKGCLHTLKEEYEDAIQALNQCIEYYSDNAEAHLILAQIYTEQGDTDKTLIHMEKYLELVPGNAEAEEMIAQSYMAKEDYENAKKWYKAVQESSGSAVSYYYYGLCEIQLGDYAGAKESLTKAIEMDDSIGEAYYYRGICELAAENYEEALKDFKIAVERTDNQELRTDIQELIDELEKITM